MQRFVVKISSWVHSVGKYKKNKQFITDIKRIKIFFNFFFQNSFLGRVR